MFVNTALWGPMFIFGVLSLSDLIRPITSLYIEHVISNLYLPAYLYGAYSFYERAVYKETWQGWAALALYSVMSLITYYIQRLGGTKAQYFLHESPEYNDSVLRPSLFYLLRWADHEPRTNTDSYDSYDYNTVV